MSQPWPFYGLFNNSSPNTADILAKDVVRTQCYFFILGPAYTYYTKSLRQTGVHLLRPPSRVRKKFRELKPQTLCPPQDISFCPLYGYKYSIFLWVTCSYRKECSLKTKDCLCCNIIYHPCSRWRCLHFLYNTFRHFSRHFLRIQKTPRCSEQ